MKRRSHRFSVTSLFGGDNSRLIVLLGSLLIISYICKIIQYYTYSHNDNR